MMLSPKSMSYMDSPEGRSWVDIGRGNSCPCILCWVCRGPQMNSHMCRVGPAHERPREPAAAGRCETQEVHPSITEWRTSAAFLSPFLHAMSYGHLGKVEGSQFPWDHCGSLAAYTRALKDSEDSDKERRTSF